MRAGTTKCYGLSWTRLAQMVLILSLPGFSLDEVRALSFDDEYPEQNPESSSKEIDTDEFAMDHTCPKCGFEFDGK